MAKKGNFDTPTTDQIRKAVGAGEMRDLLNDKALTFEVASVENLTVLIGNDSDSRKRFKNFHNRLKQIERFSDSLIEAAYRKFSGALVSLSWQVKHQNVSEQVVLHAVLEAKVLPPRLREPDSYQGDLLPEELQEFIHDKISWLRAIHFHIKESLDVDRPICFVSGDQDIGDGEAIPGTHEIVTGSRQLSDWLVDVQCVARLIDNEKLKAGKYEIDLSDLHLHFEESALPITESYDICRASAQGYKLDDVADNFYFDVDDTFLGISGSTHFQVEPDVLLLAARKFKLKGDVLEGIRGGEFKVRVSPVFPVLMTRWTKPKGYLCRSFEKRTGDAGWQYLLDLLV